LSAAAGDEAIGSEASCVGIDFSPTFDSPESAARAFLAALEADDPVELSALALNEPEFRCLVWPHLPASRPETNLSLQFVWGDLSFKSRNALAWTRHYYGGQRFELRELRFAGATSDYGAFTVSRDTRLVVSDARGETASVQLFGSMLRCRGRYKLFSFVHD
jgi:hypothetical protein